MWKKGRFQKNIIGFSAIGKEFFKLAKNLTFWYGKYKALNGQEVMTITIERFTAKDIAEATLLTLLTWGEEMALANEHLKNIL